MVILLADPVVTRTNQGSARYVMRVPRIEITSAPTRAQTDVDLKRTPRSNIKRLYGFVKYVLMPKVSDEHKERRREEILAAAQRCFAEHGYEGATVAGLEAESGLSRGAIFNYFENKEALFIELAIRTSERITEIWFEEGFRAALEAIVHEDPDWLAVQLEATRRVRTDSKFRKQVEAKEAELRAGRGERLANLREQGVRDDVALEQVGIFLSLVANGLALRRTMGDLLPDLDLLVRLVETGVAPPRQVSRSGRTRKRPVGAGRA
jgi:AcrR family transcriptional regulator